MKIIDLLNKIAEGEEVPKNIKYDGYMWFWCNSCQIYETTDDDLKTINLYTSFATEGDLNDEIEIIEEVEDKEYEDIEELEGTLLEPKEDSNLDTKILCCLANTINALIRNQKYILERLDKNE